MATKEKNELFPVFLKLNQLSVLIVGGGNVGLEKLNAIIQQSPATSVRLVATAISEKIKGVAENYPNVRLTQKAFEEKDLEDADIVIVAVNDPAASRQIRQYAKAKGKLVNVADKPDLCDFYLSSIVQKGNLKIAISTNGKSPTIAKRLKELLNDALPDEIDVLLDHMQAIRNHLKGDFAAKVDRLNKLTEDLVAKETMEKDQQ